ncbi:glutamate formimidoyltransferase [Nitrospira lenta]|uniref:Formimidoyltransferase-cyclodeaminase n=1 Tax=Nitrospira lenta TaxID=1436998 RepID=A0A330L684_9BACT|nr:glutamate formimidoyltransferase [Nitrospira lenta]SPP64816.1 putative Formimidoyltransferase-cyclodeaminase [Nitrospira lenta]
MPKIVECIPNFSEGRNPATIQALLAAVESIPGIRLLDRTSDPDHHRSVLTFAGDPDAVLEAAFHAIQIATQLIDLRRHTGVHPRIGATDVVPFVPLQGVTMEDCIQLARRLGKRVGGELNIPVFLYEQAAGHPNRTRLEAIRQGGLSGLETRMAADRNWQPDFGPSRLHERAGAIVIGARQPLIAFNVNLKTADLTIAKTIAQTIRQSNGGLPCVKAIGVPLASRGMVQISMNLTDYRVTSMDTAFHTIQTEAAKAGVEIAESELIGLVPQAALNQAAATLLHLGRFDPTQILETRLAGAHAAQPDPGSEPTLSEFLRTVSAATPTPAGGAVAALAGALAASLGTMGARIGKQTEPEQSLNSLSQRLADLMRDDCEAYEAVSRARRLPVDHADRPLFLATALEKATEVPLKIAELACEAGHIITTVRAVLSQAVQSDATVGIILAIAATEAGLHTAKTNVKLQRNQQVNADQIQRIAKIANSLEELKGLCYTPPPST